jgi:hypothetical protein
MLARHVILISFLNSYLTAININVEAATGISLNLTFAFFCDTLESLHGIQRRFSRHSYEVIPVRRLMRQTPLLPIQCVGSEEISE